LKIPPSSLPDKEIDLDQREAAEIFGGGENAFPR
jgi:hypothetical protein